MLRVTRHGFDGLVVVLRLEGRISGPWVGELRQLVEDCRARAVEVRLDLAEVDYVDASGAGLLRELLAAHVGLLGCSGFVFELLRGIPQGSPKTPVLIGPAGLGRQP